MSEQRRLTTACLTAAVGLLLTAGTAAAAMETYTIEIKDHRFHPAEVHVAAHAKVKLIIKNLDPTPEEFESYELNREKIILGGRSGIVFIGPLKPGSYPFFGDFNQDTAQGVLHVE